LPVEAKPLFRPDVIRSHLAAFSLPERVEPLRRQLADWASLLATGRANNFKEQELLPDFLTLEPARKLAAEAVKLEHEISDLVNAAYGLIPDEIALLWSTAPPRMPISAPGADDKT